MSTFDFVWRRGRQAAAALRSAAEFVSTIMGKAILTVVYFVPAAPFAIALRVFADPLHERRTAPPTWTVVDPEPATLAQARRQG